MCGIIGYYGKDNSVPYLVEGIRKLEYRGYDSFGCTLFENGKLNTYKDVGRIDDVILEYSIDKKTSSHGIFHTRWATHGGIEKKNSHPHTDCIGNISVVHNGIIENWVHLKRKLQSHIFISDTDTEVIPHLIEEHLQSDFNLLNAVKVVAKNIVGMSSFVVMHSQFDYIVAYKNGSPLVLGLGKNGNFVSSDVPSLLNFTNKFVYLQDGDIVKIGEDNYGISNIYRGETQHEIKTVNMNPIGLEKGRHEYYMEKEIFEQPTLWKKFEDYDKLEYSKISNLIKASDKIFIIGSGSSYYAAMYAARLFLKSGIQTFPVNGEELMDYANIIDEKSLFIVISQSGETADVIAGLLKFKNVRKIGIVNVPSSTIAREVEVLLKIRAGVEKAVPSTKSLSNSFIILTLLNSIINGTIKETEKQLVSSNMDIYNFIVPSVLSAIDSTAKTLLEQENVLVAGRQTAYILALEGALKLKECAYTHAEGIDLSGLKHGPLALVDDDMWTIAIVLKENIHESLMNVQEIKSRGGKIIGISTSSNELFDIYIKIPDLGPFTFMPVLMVFQFLSFKLARLKGLNPDMPRNLAKSVTVR